MQRILVPCKDPIWPTIHPSVLIVAASCVWGRNITVAVSSLLNAYIAYAHPEAQLLPPHRGTLHVQTHSLRSISQFWLALHSMNYSLAIRNATSLRTLSLASTCG